MDFAPVHMHPDIFEDGEFFSVLAFNAHVNGFQKRSPEWRFSKTPTYRLCKDENGGFRAQ